ncbi:sugar ABC transporter ATP-binding protein [Microvirga sesbaniae]|uniref:sugar ABC transporter ATP-binding protein n=1 Tax=Microvirga sesbaniae TaxID=681392 RepID=UPI0021C66791|nr:sugar ABC transporter ATP-binding protein [Microvirga sp. HBU67692]
MHALSRVRPSEILKATGIDKTFDRTRALQGATLELRAGEVHGLLGANGAGKSTLSKVISGHVIPDRGEVVFKGQALRVASTRDALEAGIAIVMQETSLAPDLSVLENIFLPELGRPGRLSRGRLRQRARELLARLGHEHMLPLDQEVRDLSAAQRQLVEISKALALNTDLIIFDEPTASLSPSEVERLFEIMDRLRQDGHALVFVSHRLEEVFAITDRVTIMREGRTVAASLDTASLSQSDLVRHMVGQDLGSIYARTAEAREPDRGRSGEFLLAVEGLSAPPHVVDVSFGVRGGEILGLGGLVGAGRSEAAEAIFGLRPRARGTITLSGRPIAPRSPAEAIAHGIGFIPEDRRTQNIVPDLSVKENLLLAHLGAYRGFGHGYRKREAAAARLMERLGLPADRLLDTNMLTFSGGMQQKVIIARWLLLEPAVLILDEPTKGVDIGTRSSIYAILREVASQGVAVVLISSDFEELLGLADRIVVLSDGRSIADLPSALLDEVKLTLLAAPRTSMARNTALLDAISADHSGAAFWVLIDSDELICLNLVEAAGSPSPGLRTGEAMRIAETRISRALMERQDGFVAETDVPLSTVLVPMRNPRGHDFGWIGLTVDSRMSIPSARLIRTRVEALMSAD